jgi:ureidoacrylate peracid hydrolase
MLTTLTQKINPKHAAVLVIDMQNDFCHENGVIAKQGRDMTFKKAMAPKLVRFLSEARRHRVPVIFIRQINLKETLSDAAREQKRRTQPKYGKLICRKGSWGSRFYAVAPEPGEIVVTKHRYSAFADTNLDLILRSVGIRTLIMTGVATNACVESTARDGFMKDYYIVFLSDCTATSSQEDHEATLRNINTYFGVVADSSELVNIWQKAG